MLLTECDGHADTDDSGILEARARFDALCAEFAPEVQCEAEAVREAGGLFIIGTERHSRAAASTTSCAAAQAARATPARRGSS